jgi:hypothetical protein
VALDADSLSPTLLFGLRFLSNNDVVYALLRVSQINYRSKNKLYTAIIFPLNIVKRRLLIKSLFALGRLGFQVSTDSFLIQINKVKCRKSRQKKLQRQYIRIRLYSSKVTLPQDVGEYENLQKYRTAQTA